MTKMPWFERPLCAFDTETTGPKPKQDRLVTACVARIDGAAVQLHNYIADPGIEIPAEATEVHGVTTEYARTHGRPHHEVVREVAKDLEKAWKQGYVVTAYNAAFDLTLIQKHVPGFKIGGLVIDPYVIDRELDKYRRGGRKLTDVCAHYGVKQVDAHQAEGDALAAARLAWKMTRSVYPILTIVGEDQMMTYQADWHQARQRDFAQYKARRKEPVHDISFGWPIAA